MDAQILDAGARDADGGETLIVPIEGMTCASCVGRVERAIRQVEGVAEVSVNLATERAEVRFKGGESSPGAVSEAIFKAGYVPGGRTIELSITGMTCASCVGRVERALMKVPGVFKAQVNLATEMARVETIAATPSALIDAVEKAGYSASLHEAAAASAADHKEARREAVAARELRHVIIAALLSLPLVAPMLLAPFGVDLAVPGWLQLLLAAPVQFWLGARFYRAGWKAVRAGTGNMLSAKFGLDK